MVKYNEVEEVIAALREFGDPSEKNLAGMLRFGINPENALCIPIPAQRKFAKAIGKNHALALELMHQNIHEAVQVGIFIAEPALFASSSADEFVQRIASWDICDNFCFTIMDKVPYALEKIAEWSADEREYVRRAAFSLIASIAVHDRKERDEYFEPFFELIIKYSFDERNFVKKAVNWALRQIGKRNIALNKRALEVAREILALNTKAGNWIARDAIRELENPKRIGTKGVSI